MVMRSFSGLLLAITLLISPPCSAEEVILNAVVATVDGEPFTLHELCQRLSPPRSLTFAEASLDPEARQVLDDMIMSRLVETEAAGRRIFVNDQEVEGYIDQLAARNNLSRKEFEAALLRQQGKAMPVFKKEVSAQILKSKLAGELIRGGLAVSDEEVDKYLAEHPELKQGAGKIRLSQIAVFIENRGETEARLIIEKARRNLEEGENFGKIAAEYSDSPDAAQGGLIGLVDEKDLDSRVFDAVFALKDGEISDIVQTPMGFHVFKVEQRLSAEGEEHQMERIREEALQALKQRKLETKLQSYFEAELYNNHSVDKKM